MSGEGKVETIVGVERGEDFGGDPLVVEGISWDDFHQDEGERDDAEEGEE